MRSRLAQFAPALDFGSLTPVEHEEWQEWQLRQRSQPKKEKTELWVLPAFAERRVMVPYAGVDPDTKSASAGFVALETVEDG